LLAVWVPFLAADLGIFFGGGVSVNLYLIALRPLTEARHFSDALQATGTRAFDPIVVVAGLIPFLGMILVLMLVHNTRATGQGMVRRI